jgi:SRSO17 transposase
MLAIVKLSFAECFKTRSPNDVLFAERYVAGLLTEAPRKNMERMDEHLGKGRSPDKNLGVDSYQGMQQFISSSPWDESLVYAEISRRANQRLGGSKDTTLVIDESANAKKGDKSVGASRQWNGRLGKQDNCQVGVHSVLNLGTHTAMIGTRLALATEWTDDPERCRKAGVPEARLAQGAPTKIDLARELIDEAVANGVQFACVSFDAFYGRDSKLRRYIDSIGLIYCADIPANTLLFDKKPSGQARPEKITEHATKAEDMANKMVRNKRKPGQSIVLREGENGIVTAKVWTKRVWEWSAGEDSPQELWLIVREMADGKLKLTLSNAGAKTTLKRLARWQAGRFYVERCFQDAKSHCGMSEYQARGWRAWHHHMALVALALYLTMEERQANPMEMPMLSVADIIEMMEWALVKQPTAAELMERIKRRHTKRAANGRNAVARDRKRKVMGKAKIPIQ